MLKGIFPFNGQDSKPRDQNRSTNTYDSNIAANHKQHADSIKSKGLRKILKKQADCLKEICRDLEDVKNRKFKEDKKLVLDKVKQIEKAISRNEESKKFEQFKQDLFDVT